ncbi:MAG TPA: DEAD/DEAH box helicase [Xanthobacteraceae bacterium]|jgi:CRISPR-associated endonuclease/helicase Cas3
MVEEVEQFRCFFRAAAGVDPYLWQIKAGLNGLPQLLPVPTGLGKTEGSVLAWAWRRFAQKNNEPLHLIYCLPMRSLVRQTKERLNTCFARLRSWDDSIDIPVYQLIGGDAEEGWASAPDRPWVLVGTQDMLLSRALNRGYGMSRFDWPLHFGVLNQDCHWIVDEVQLMGPGLWTTAQLDWMRHKRFPGLKPCRTTWMSATMGLQFLQTADRKRDGYDKVEPFEPEVENDSNEELRRRRSAWRPVQEFQPEKGKVIEQIALAATLSHTLGTLTLIVCNTVETAQKIFEIIGTNGTPRILLTSRFRAGDRREAEEKLQTFESRRCATQTGRIEGGDPGLICVSTQVIEAGLDISAHRLWTEHCPWPSLIQRLGRLNRDGKDNDARAIVWRILPEIARKHDGEDWVGPYRKAELDCASSLLKRFVPISEEKAAADALGELQLCVPQQVRDALAISPEPCPRAIDVHGLFSTEADLYGGFTDVSRFVRNPDPDADVIVFWRAWSGEQPPRGDALEGPHFDSQREACPVPAHKLREFLKAARARPWLWNDRAGRWNSIPLEELRPGMVVMLNGNAGGYESNIGWSGKASDRLSDLQPPGSGRALDDDRRADSGYWSMLGSHLSDARTEAERLCNALGLDDTDPKLGKFGQAVVAAASFHDLGKAHPDWQRAVPSRGPLEHEPIAKFPKVLRVETSSSDAERVRSALSSKLPNAYPLSDEVLEDKKSVRLQWALDQAVNGKALENIRRMSGVRWAAHKAFRPGLRHEAASALAMWQQRRVANEAPYSVLAIYLCAAHHGKVRTVLRTISSEGRDVFGIGPSPEAFQFDGRDWPMDRSIAVDGADGRWTDEGFILVGPGWTGLIADLLGPWRGDADATWTGAVPNDEPRALGPFALSWLEALVRVADWRASDNPSHLIRPSDCAL